MQRSRSCSTCVYWALETQPTVASAPAAHSASADNLPGRPTDVVCSTMFVSLPSIDGGVGPFAQTPVDGALGVLFLGRERTQPDLDTAVLRPSCLGLVGSDRLGVGHRDGAHALARQTRIGEQPDHARGARARQLPVRRVLL